MKRIAILTGGGDAPGLNAVIRAAVKTAIREYGCEVIGVRDGYDGFIEEKGIMPLELKDVRGILPRGGTILGTANRGNPFARKVMRDGKEVTIDVSDEVVRGIERLKLDALLVLGGDGTLHIAHELAQKGVPVIGVPKTIDNDIGGTDITFGFDTALTIATEAIDRLHTTAEAHHRVMVLELMGRDAGFIALHSGVAGGADVILIPEIPFKFESVVAKVRGRAKQGSYFSIMAVSEGAKPAGGEKVYARSGNDLYVPRSGRHQSGGRGVHRKSGIRDARHSAGTPPARRHTDRLRPLAGNEVRRRGCPRGRGGKVRPHGFAGLRQSVGRPFG
jgi:ATP-dependent phosphofructokinase / diphosphate-dependent phosphofructokinase